MIKGLLRGRSTAHLSPAFRLPLRRLFGNRPQPSSSGPSRRPQSAAPSPPERPVFNKEVSAFYDKHGFGLWNELKWLPGQSSSKYGFRASLARRHLLYIGHMEIYDFFGHPMIEMSKAKYAAQDVAEPLWVWMDVINAKAVVRRTATKVLKKALRTAMRLNGYDPQGRMLKLLPQQDTQRTANETGKPPGRAARFLHLRGTLRLFVQDPKLLLKSPFPELVKYLHNLISAQIEPGLTGKPAGPPKPKEDRQGWTPGNNSKPKPRADSRDWKPMNRDDTSKPWHSNERKKTW